MSRKNRILLPAEVFSFPNLRRSAAPAAAFPSVGKGGFISRRGRYTLERNHGQIKITARNLHLMDKGAGGPFLVFEQRGRVKRFCGGARTSRTAWALFHYFADKAEKAAP